MTDDATLPIPLDTGRRQVTLDRLTDIPEEEIWLQKQKSARTRRAYRLDVQHFMRTLAITTPAELRQADHKAVIAWERFMRETEQAAPSTIRRRLAARRDRGAQGRRLAPKQRLRFAARIAQGRPARRARHQSANRGAIARLSGGLGARR